LDGISEGWRKETEREEGRVNCKWGEGQDSVRDVSVKKYRWQEKLERDVDYWEKFYEEELALNRTDVKASGHKEFKNNRGYYFKEEWT
jgi:hypothetical protein